MAGSGLFSNKRPVTPPLVQLGKHGVPGEVADLRKDVADTLAPLAGIVVEEFTNALAAATALMAATPSVVATRRLAPGAAAAGTLTSTVVANLAAAPRQLVFTTAGTTAANQPATATVTGKDERGRAQTEVVALPQAAGSITTNKFFSSVSYVDLSAGKGTGATLAIALGAKIGLSRKLLARAGAPAVIREIAAGAVVTTGTFALASVAGNGTYGSYTPAATLDGVVDFAVYYEADPTA